MLKIFFFLFSFKWAPIEICLFLFRKVNKRETTKTDSFLYVAFYVYVFTGPDVWINLQILKKCFAIKIKISMKQKWPVCMYKVFFFCFEQWYEKTSPNYFFFFSMEDLLQRVFCLKIIQRTNTVHYISLSIMSRPLSLLATRSIAQYHYLWFSKWGWQWVLSVCMFL